VKVERRANDNAIKVDQMVTAAGKRLRSLPMRYIFCRVNRWPFSGSPCFVVGGPLSDQNQAYVSRNQTSPTEWSERLRSTTSARVRVG
jgi:hypothetical protein